MEKVESESPRLSQMWQQYLLARDSELCRLAVIRKQIRQRHGEKVETVLDLVRTRKEDFTLEEMVTEGFAGVCCVEAGGPSPGLGCAGRGIISPL